MSHCFPTAATCVVSRISRTLMAVLLLAAVVQCPAPARADTNVAANTGRAEDTIIGNNNMRANDTGIAVNGEVRDANLNNNQNSITNANQNYIAAPYQTRGGNSMLVMPRNPLALPNAALGRSNFGLQFGVQNNPGLAAATGAQNAMGWFLQGGLTIPFGKIPEMYRNPDGNRMDQAREDSLDRQRMVFGEPLQGKPQPQARKNVHGRVLLNAYNYGTVPSERLQNLPNVLGGIAPAPAVQPRVLALAPAEVFSRPLNTGEQVGVVEAGQEYPYLGHTRSGWVKLMLPNGKEGWTSSRFEYIKNDFTEIDSLAVDPGARQRQGSAPPPPGKGG